MSTFKEKTTKYSSFVNNKNRKKQANIQDTVDICHQKTMNAFKNKHEMVNKWKTKIEKYKNEITNIKKTNGSIENDMKIKLYQEKIDMFQKNVDDIESNSAELDYFYKTGYDSLSDGQIRQLRKALLAVCCDLESTMYKRKLLSHGTVTPDASECDD